MQLWLSRTQLPSALTSTGLPVKMLSYKLSSAAETSMSGDSRQPGTFLVCMNVAEQTILCLMNTTVPQESALEGFNRRTQAMPAGHRHLAEVLK